MKQKAKILAIESSCDETAAAVVEDGRKVLSNVISSQIEIHTVYGGVVPEIASRKHLEAIDGVIEKALTDSGCTWEDIDAIAVTQGPGLVGALLVGVSEAKSLAYALHKPLIGVHHIEGHIAANYISDPDWEPPFLCLVISGGHTYLCIVEDYGAYRMLGETRDDAAGEAFDKVARAIGLGYPGGPKLQKAALAGDPEAFHFPRPCLDEPGYDFSFSGLKSAVLNYLNAQKMKHIEINRADVAASFQKAVIEVLVAKALDAMRETGLDTLVLAGGVAANSALEVRLREAAAENGIAFYYPSKILCTDNAAMIACRGYYMSRVGEFADLYLNAVPGLSLTDKGE